MNIRRRLTSPAIQMITIGDLCAERWKISRSTLYNWIDLGLVPRGHKMKHCQTLFWYSNEIDEIERELISMGYLKRHNIHNFFSKLLAKCFP